MNLFNRLFSAKGSSQDSDNLPAKEKLMWLPLTRVDQITEIEEQSNDQLVVIFKHSTRCGISRMVWNQFQANADFPQEQVALYYQDLLSYREVSDAVAERFQVYHQSPQLIVLQHKEVVHHASHSAIVPSVINRFIDLGI